MKERLPRLPETARGHTTSVHGLKKGLEEILRTISISVVPGCVQAAEHLQEAWLACAQSSNDGGTPLSLQLVETMVIENKKALRSREMHRRRDVGSYQNELEIIQAMLNEHAGALLVCFKPSWNDPPIDFGASNIDVDGPDESSIVFADPDDFKGVEICTRQQWIDEMAATQNPTYIWERLTKPQSTTVPAVRNIGDSVKVVVEMER